jgi:thiosulfate reductase cytochrome b subunit
MFLFSKEGRDAFLTFVRNLPAQIILLSPCVFLPKLQNFDSHSFSDIAAWFCVAAIFAFAFSANIIEFINANLANDEVRNVKAGLREAAVTGPRFWFLLFWRARRQLLNFWLAMVICYIGVLVVFAMVFWGVFGKFGALRA